jgi:tetratricopeptide (TPR) repeat protein
MQMKKVLHSLGIIVLGAIFIVEAHGNENAAGNASTTNTISGLDNSPAPPPALPGMSSLLPPSSMEFSVSSVFRDYSRIPNTKRAALKANPDLAAEEQAFEDEHKAWQDKLDQEMIKNDPGMASIVPKMRLQDEIGEAASKGTPLQNVDLSKCQVSQREFQEANEAQEAAFKSNPDLETQRTQWMQKMRVFNQKVEVAMVEIDPGISPMLGGTAEAEQKDKEAMANGPAPDIVDIDAMAARMKLHQDLYQKIRDQAFAAFAKESFMLPVEDQDRMKALIRIEAYLSVWGDFYGEGLHRKATHYVAYETHLGMNSILLVMLAAEDQLDGNYSEAESDAQTVNRLVETFDASDYPAEWKMVAWQVAITNAINFRTFGYDQSNSQSLKEVPHLFEKWGESYRQMIKAALQHDVLCDEGNGLLCVTQNEPDMLDLAIGEIDRDFNEADSANPVRLAMDGQYFVDSAWSARGSGWASSVSDQGFKLFGDRLAKADAILEPAYEKYPNEGEIARTMIDVELGQGQGKDRMEMWFQRAIKTNPDDYDACKAKEWYLQPRWYGSLDDILSFGKECLDGNNWSAKLPMILTTSLAEASQQDPSIYDRPDVWALVEKTYRSYFDHYPKNTFYRTAFAEHAFDSGHMDIAKEQLTILGDDWDRASLTVQKYFVMTSKLGLLNSH